MADLSWLRLGQRSRIPIVSKPPTTSERASIHDPDEHRRLMPSRVSSYLSLNSRFSFSPEPPTPTRSPDLFVRDQDKVWHKPSLDQMVEALQVVMMTKGVLKPIPMEYNSYVLHLIEGFRDMQERVQAANVTWVEAKQIYNQTSDDFKTVTDEWRRRENQYKAEIKRLEVILAQMSRDGLETVTLARTGSVIDRGVPDPKIFISRLKELRSRPRRQELSQLDSHDNYSVFFEQTTSTDTSSAKSFERIETTDHTCGDTNISRIRDTRPNILDQDKDFLVSERFRTREVAAASASSNQPDQMRPRTYRQARAHIQDEARSTLFATKAAQQSLTGRTVEQVAGQQQISSDGATSSPESDTKSGNVITENMATTRRTSHGLRHRLLSGKVGSGSPVKDSNDSESRARREPRGVSEYLVGPSGVLPTKGTRFSVPQSGRYSFVAGDDTVAVMLSQETRYIDYELGETRFEPEKPTPRRNEQGPQRLLDDRVDNFNTSARYSTVRPRYSAGAIRVASPSQARESYKTESGDKPILLRSDGSAGTIGTGTHVREDGSPYSRNQSPTSGKNTTAKNGSTHNSQSPGSLVAGAQVGRIYPSPRERTQRQNSAQIAASWAVERQERQESDFTT